MSVMDVLREAGRGCSRGHKPVSYEKLDLWSCLPFLMSWRWPCEVDQTEANVPLTLALPDHCTHQAGAGALDRSRSCWDL
jgi:hypothetical protein